MRLVVMTFVSLDGVYQGPGSPDEDRSDGFSRGGWFVPYLDQAFLEQAREWLQKAGGLLLGRRTYESFSRDWPEMNKPDDAIGLMMNSLPKYVASSSLKTAGWGPATILAGDTVQQVQALKAQDGGELQVHGSGSLARSLLAAGSSRATCSPARYGWPSSSGCCRASRPCARRASLSVKPPPSGNRRSGRAARSSSAPGRTRFPQPTP